MNKHMTKILWVLFALAMLNSLSISANAVSAIHQIYGGIFSIVATLIFCTIIIRATIKEEFESISTKLDKLVASSKRCEKDEE